MKIYGRTEVKLHTFSSLFLPVLPKSEGSSDINKITHKNTKYLMICSDINAI
jgi:hypothetical protein